MHAAQILGVGWLKRAVAQVKALRQIEAHHLFEAGQHQIRANLARRNDTIVMRPVRARKHLPGCYSLPEGVDFERREPLLNILNVFENAHGDSVSETARSKQI